jgi:prepilin-type processing-associated H-X9-DG protein
MTLYANNNKGAMFWRGADLGRDGMDWYAYGGRETGNKYVGAQGDFFNRWVPRPLNRYVGGALNVFVCPQDTYPWHWAQDWTCVEWVGTSYQFNANGCPYVPDVPDVDGLAGVKMAAVRRSSQTIMFLDAPMGRGVSWHGRARGNICFVDGHVAMLQIPWEARTQEYEW